VYVERADGFGRHRVAGGLLRGWAPDGHLVLFTGDNGDFASGSFRTLDLRSGRERTVLSSAGVAAFAHRPAQLGGMAFSADGRYVAARVVFGRLHFGLWGVVIARTDGRIVRLVTTKDVISMLAWSSHGHKLAYTTSGFPAPHELYVLSSPHAAAHRILSQVEHFDWVSWSPDGRWLLIDNEHQHAWLLLRLTGHRQAQVDRGASVPARRLPRLGGMPLWCCLQDTYAGA
jgi:hypothetical protein